MTNHLQTLMRRKSLTILGMNTGTSADGLDLAVVTIRRVGARFRAVSHGGMLVPYPSLLRSAVLTTAESVNVSLDSLARLDQSLGEWMGLQAASVTAELRKRGVAVDAIASHGQTIRHLPVPVRQFGSLVRASVQIGSLSRIAAQTGLVTVGDFRQADIALGGEGAPITTAAIACLFHSDKENRVVLNIGGMANYFYLPSQRNHAIDAADCGPGNSLSDAICQLLVHKPYDAGGRIARSGKSSSHLRAKIDAYFFHAAGSLKTRSTGREQFGTSHAAAIVRAAHKLRLSPGDTLATVGEWTIDRVIDNLRSLPAAPANSRGKATKLYLTGGGRKNSFFVGRLEDALKNKMEVAMIDQLGIDGDLVEATSFALLGAACLFGHPLATPAAESHPDQLAISGVIAQPPQRVRR